MRKLMWFTLGFAAGCALCVYLLPDSWQLLALAAAVALIALALSLPERFRRSAVCVCIGLSLSICWCILYRQLFPMPTVDPAGEKRTISAEVSGLPEQKSYGVRVEANLELDGRKIPASLTLTACEEELLPGDRIEGEFTLKPALQEKDGEVNYYYVSSGVRIVGSGKSYTVSSPEKVPLRYIPLRIARKLNLSLARAVPADCLGFLQSITTGNRGNLSEEDRDALSTSGASHVIAIAGMHVSMIVLLFFLVFGRGKRAAAAVCIPLMVLFVLMTGASPSVVRAAIMQSILLLAPVFWRENDPPTSLSTAALALLAANPWVVSNVSFQLSFAAVAGLLLATPPVYRWLAGLPGIRRILALHPRKQLSHLPIRLLRTVVHFVVGCVSATLGAMLFTTPISASVFGFVPLYGILTNVLILPAVMVCFIGGLLTAVVGLALPGAASVMGGLLAWPVRWIFLVCRRVSVLPFAALPVKDPYVITFLLVAYLILGLAVVMRIRRVDLPLAGLAAALALTLVLYGRSMRVQSFSVAALDVGQGQCICMQTKSFTAVLDCGGDGGARAGILCARFLRQSGADQIDALILTHYDLDHISGVETLLSSMDVQTIYLPDVPFDEETRLRIAQAAQEAGTETVLVSADLTLTFPEGSLTVFGPVSLYDDNAASLAVLFSAGDYDMLATGDMDFYSEYDLMLTHELPEVEAFVAGHHGSKYASSRELLEQIRPQTVLISVGAGNSYGHPSKEALDRFAAVGATILRTDEIGDVIIRR